MINQNVAPLVDQLEHDVFTNQGKWPGSRLKAIVFNELPEYIALDAWSLFVQSSDWGKPGLIHKVINEAYIRNR